MPAHEPLPRTLAAPAHPDDDGTGDPRVSDALARSVASPADAAAYVAALAALGESRLLVPVVAVAGVVELDDAGLAHDKTSDMATVLLTGADGRVALLAFTSLATMAQWDPAARPVPVTAEIAAQAAVQDGADALVVDLAGPARLAVEADDLLGLARGWRPVLVDGARAWIGRPSE